MKMSWEEEFNATMAALGGTIVPELIEYRLHYDESGKIILCSQQNHPEDTQYLVVDQGTYADYMKYSVDVKTKQLKKVVIDPGVSVQLKRSSQGYAVVCQHAGLILEQGETWTEVEYYEPNS
jgi:hypothetical protein